MATAQLQFQPISTVGRGEVVGASVVAPALRPRDVQRVFSDVHDHGYFKGTLLVRADVDDDLIALRDRYLPEADLVAVVDPTMARRRTAVRTAVEIPADASLWEDALFALNLCRPDVVLFDAYAVGALPAGQQRRIADVLALHVHKTGATVLATRVDTADHLNLAIVLGAQWVQGMRDGRPSAVVPTARHSMLSDAVRQTRPFIMAKERVEELRTYVRVLAAAGEVATTTASVTGSPHDRQPVPVALDTGVTLLPVDDGEVAMSPGWSCAVLAQDIGDASTDSWPDSCRRYEVTVVSSRADVAATLRDLTTENSAAAPEAQQPAEPGMYAGIGEGDRHLMVA